MTKIKADDAKAWRKEARRLRAELTKLIDSTQVYINYTDELFRQPATYDRGRLQGQAISKLELVVDSARHFGLGKKLMTGTIICKDISRLRDLYNG